MTSRGAGVGLSKSVLGRERFGDGVRHFTRRLLGRLIGSFEPSGVKRESVLNGCRCKSFVGESAGTSPAPFLRDR